MRLIVNGTEVLTPFSLPYSQSLLRGDGIFETILALDQQIIAWERHFERFAKSAQQLLMTIPAKIDLEVAINKLLVDQVGKSRIRITVLTDGSWIVVVQKVVESNSQVTLIKMDQPVISNGPLSGVKSISYGQSMLAVRIAESRGFTDGVYLNEKDFVVETGLSNIIILEKDKFITPALESGCLPGITRQILIKNFDIQEGLFTWEQLLSADAVYLCSSIQLIRSVSKIEDKLFEENEKGLKLIGDLDQLIRSKIEV